MKRLITLALPACLFFSTTTAQNALTYNSAVPTYIEVGSSMNSQLTGTNTLTVEGWCYLTSNVFLPTVIGNYLSGMQFLLRVDGGKTAFWIDNGTGFKNLNGATTIPLSTWVHIAAVWDGSVMKVYLNGVLDNTSAAVVGAFPTSTNPVRIGANQLSEAWAGKLDQVRVWATARTVTEINNNMSSCLSGSETGLLALYNFEEGSGTTVADLTGHGYNGSLINAPAWTTGHTCNAILPVNFESISAGKDRNNILINWKTGTETNILRYTVERSNDNRNFTTLATITATGSGSYNWLDQATIKGLSFYRIKSVAISGDVSYSATVKIAAGDDHTGITVWPNPVKGNILHLQFTNTTKEKYQLQLSDIAGRKIFSSSIENPAGNSGYNVELPVLVTPGMYQLLIIDTNKTATTQKVFIGY